jgi:hypothetical protein
MVRLMSARRDRIRSPKMARWTSVRRRHPQMNGVDAAMNGVR